MSKNSILYVVLRKHSNFQKRVEREKRLDAGLFKYLLLI